MKLSTYTNPIYLIRSASLRPLAVTLAILAGVIIGPAIRAQPVTTITDDDGIYQIHVDASGSWNAITGPNHPSGPAKNLLFDGMRVNTSFSTFRIYNQDGTADDFPLFNQDAILEQDSPLAPGQGWRTKWEIGGLDVTQDVLIVGSTADNSAIYHTVEVRNAGRGPAVIGWRNLYDWNVNDPGFDDGPSNLLEPRCGVLTRPETQEICRAPVTEQVARVSILPGTPTYQPLLALTFDPGYRSDLPVTPPDEYGFVSWPDAVGTEFDYTCTPGRNITTGPIDDSAGLSWWGRDRDRALEILPGGSRRLTQVIFAQLPDSCPRTCLRFHRDRVQCVGDGSGDYVYDVTIRNRSESEVHALQITGLPAGVTATIDPPIFPIRHNQPRRFQVRFQGAGPGPLSFSITLLDAMDDIVCSVERTIELPECECAQAVRVRAPLCFPFFTFGQPAPLSWELDLQNLFPGDVHHVLLTPESPSHATFEPSVFNPGDPLSLGDTGRFRTKIGNVDPGEQVCFRISSHDAQFEDCCSIMQCVTIPRCTIDIFDYQPLGNANLDFLDDGLVVSNIGSSGQDGVSIDLGEAIGWDAEWLPIDLASLPAGATLRQTIVGELDGQPGQSIATLETVNTGAGVELRTDFSALGTTTHTIAAFLDGDLMGIENNVPTAINFTPKINTDSHYTFGGPIPAGFESISCDPEQVTRRRCTLAGYTFEEPVPFTLASFEGLVDQIVVMPEQVAADLGPLSALELRASDVPPITLTSANAVEDCNGNGLPDYEDILSLESSDGDRDGIPDECTPSCSDPNNLCLNQERFRVEVSWRDFADNTGAGSAIPLTGETGYFWFFDPDNVEVVIKVLDGCGFNDRFWVFAAGLTNVEVELTVTETVTGEVKTYTNPLGRAFSPILDTDAFDSCSAAGQDPSDSSATSDDLARATLADLKQTLETGAADQEYAPKATTLALNDGRFLVEARWETPAGNSGDGEAVALTDETGYFWFFSPHNVEVVIKALDGCGFNDRFWVFAAGLTNVEVELTVTDTVSGQMKTYVNPLGMAFEPIQDTTAFATCS
ncbi:MAG: hypothetical protein GY719_22935 [bacterium]|nr:hypothetical protein [bacterium]